MAKVSIDTQLKRQQLILNVISGRKTAYVTIGELMELEPFRFKFKSQVYRLLEKQPQLRKQIAGIGKCINYTKYKQL